MSSVARLAGSRAWVLAVAALLALPLVVTGGRRVLGQIRVPGVQSGDEPHYLVMIHSLLDDRDLDLANNYRSAHEGSLAAGRRYAGAPLDHHTVWFVDGARMTWRQLFEDRADRWDRDTRGHPRPRPRAGAADVSGHSEYSWHQAGLPLLLAPALAPFRGTAAVEPLALVGSVAVSLLALGAFRGLLRTLGANPIQTNALSALVFLGTPLWFYARSLFTEPYLTACVLGAYWLALGRGIHLPAGILIALGILMKPPFGLVLIPLAVRAGWRRDARALAALSVPALLATGVILWQNHSMFGSPWRSSQPFEIGSVVHGLGGLWFAVRHGILATSPIAAAALAGWPYLLKQRPGAALPLASAFGLYLLLTALWSGWTGGHSYGPRLIVPVLPLLLLGLLGLVRSPLWRRGAVRVATGSLAFVSVAFNGWAALDYPEAFDNHALLELMKHLPGGGPGP